MEMEKCKVFMFSNGKESFMALLLHSKAMGSRDCAAHHCVELVEYLKCTKNQLDQISLSASSEYI